MKFVNKLLCLRITLAIFVLILSVFLSGCFKKTYPQDHEQLSEEERIIIRFSHIVGEQTPKGRAARRFAELVNERSNGYVEVQVFPNGYLFKDGEELEALRKNEIHMIAPAISKITSVVPEFQVFDLPFAFKSVEEVHDYLKSEVGISLMEQLQVKGLQPLSVWDNGFKQMTNTNRPLIYPEDFEGLQFRTMPSPVIKSQFSSLHAQTHTKSFNELFQLLESNVDMGQENTFSNIYTKKLHYLQDYMTVSNHGYLGYVVLMNQSYWRELPKDVKILIQSTIEEVTKWEIELAKDLNKQNYMELEACKCMNIHHLTDVEKQHWKNAFQPVYKEVEKRVGEKYIYQLPNEKKHKE